MFTQKQFFKALMMSALFFISRTLTAVSPHKTGAQIEGDAYGQPYAEWNVWGYAGLFLIFLCACIAFQMVQGEKSQRYDN